jgi:hypothetical protein
MQVDRPAPVKDADSSELGSRAQGSCNREVTSFASGDSQTVISLAPSLSRYAGQTSVTSQPHPETWHPWD